MAREAPERNNITFVSLKRTKKNEIPVLIYKEKINGQKVESESTFLSGAISKIISSSYEWPEGSGKMVYGYKIFMQDKDHKYSFGLAWTWMSRGILNCLANNEIPGEVSFEVQPSEQGGDGYPKCWVNVGGETCKWKWKFKELQDMIDYSSDDADYVKLDEFLDDAIVRDISPKYEEWFARMSKDGMFAGGPVEEEKDELLEAVKESEAKSEEETDIPQHPGSSAYEKSEESAPDLPVVEEENDDLPF